MCWNIETRKARLNDQEDFWRMEGKVKRSSHPGSFTNSVATVESKHRALRGARRKAKELAMVEMERRSLYFAVLCHGVRLDVERGESTRPENSPAIGARLSDSKSIAIRGEPVPATADRSCSRIHPLGLTT